MTPLSTVRKCPLCPESEMTLPQDRTARGCGAMHYRMNGLPPYSHTGGHGKGPKIFRSFDAGRDHAASSMLLIQMGD